MLSKYSSETFGREIVDALESGKGFRKISKQLEINHSTVMKIIHKGKLFKTTVNTPRSGRPRKFNPWAYNKFPKILKLYHGICTYHLPMLRSKYTYLLLGDYKKFDLYGSFTRNAYHQKRNASRQDWSVLENTWRKTRNSETIYVEKVNSK